MHVAAIIFIGYMATGVLTSTILYSLRRDFFKPDQPSRIEQITGSMVLFIVFAFLWPILWVLSWESWVIRPNHNFARDLRISPTGLGYWIQLRSGVSIPFGDAWEHRLGDKTTNETNHRALDNSAHHFTLDGKVFIGKGFGHFGDVSDRISAEKTAISQMIVMREARGYWLLDANGQVYNFGAAAYYGDMQNLAGYNVSQRWMKPFNGTRPAKALSERTPTAMDIALATNDSVAG